MQQAPSLPIRTTKTCKATQHVARTSGNAADVHECHAVVARWRVQGYVIAFDRMDAQTSLPALAWKPDGSACAGMLLGTAYTNDGRIETSGTNAIAR